MTATNGWPGKPGVPLNPDLRGWHWLYIYNGIPIPVYWDGYWLSKGEKIQADALGPRIKYWAPCLTPSEVEIAKGDDAKWHEGYAVGVLDVRRGTAFGEPDTHYAALQKRAAELEGALDDLLRCTEKHVFGDECKAQRDKARAALTGGKE